MMINENKMMIKMWKRVDVIFTLKSPLHIGYLPFKGSVVSPTRYYIPGKNFWGAVTKRATEYFYKSPTKEYREIGKQIKENFRFSYFYLYDGETIFIPKYDESGFTFGDKKQLNKFQFEHKFIVSRVLTEVDPTSGTAKDEKLHEIEFIKDKFVNEEGDIKNTKIIGSIWVKEDFKLNNFEIKIEKNGIFINEFNLLEKLTLGGEQNYGFGLVKLESILQHKKFPIEDRIDNESNEIKIILDDSRPIISHLKYDKSIVFKGEIELLTGRGYFDIEQDNLETIGEYKTKPGRIFSKIDYYITPGSIVMLKNNINFILDWNGILISVKIYETH